MSVNDLIKKWDLLENPFSISSAERESNRINIDSTDYFIEPSYFDQIVGTPKAPTSCIVYGYRGDGKSFICNEMRKELSNKVFVVDYMRFENIDVKIVKNISLDYHICEIIKLCLIKLIEEIEKIPLKLSFLDKDKRTTLSWFINKYHPKSYESLEILQDIVGDFSISSKGFFAKKVYKNLKNYFRRIINDPEKEYKYKYLDNLTYLESLKELISIIIYTGFDAIYIIIDKLEENGGAPLSDIQLAQFISPLFASLDYLELKQFATKFFIPSQVWYAINSDNIRLDRIDKFEIKWSNKDLLNMLNIRLKSFSAPDKQVSYNQFVCPMSINYFESSLLYYSANSPRNLLKIFNYILRSFYEIKDENQDKIKCINEIAIDEGIRLFYKDRLWESDSELYTARLKETVRYYNKDKLALPYSIY